MSETSVVLRLVLAVFATWRVTHLLAKEDGPADLIFRLRARLGQRLVGKLMDCFYCLSLWIALPMALLVSRRPIDLILTWLAISGAACLLERMGEEPVVIQQVNKPEEVHDLGMLRTETTEFQEHFISDDTSSHTTNA